MESIVPISFGAQSDTEYDRDVTENLRRQPVNPVYLLNGFSAGGFLQMRPPMRRRPHWQLAIYLGQEFAGDGMVRMGWEPRRCQDVQRNDERSEIAGG